MFYPADLKTPAAQAQADMTDAHTFVDTEHPHFCQVEHITRIPQVPASSQSFADTPNIFDRRPLY